MPNAEIIRTFLLTINTGSTLRSDERVPLWEMDFERRCELSSKQGLAVLETRESGGTEHAMAVVMRRELRQGEGENKD